VSLPDPPISVSFPPVPVIVLSTGGFDMLLPLPLHEHVHFSCAAAAVDDSRSKK
jgi:hypothetical protein